MKNKNLLSHRYEEPERSVLYMVGTPIGNLNDLSYRAINILRNVSLIACEDTRHTKKIMNKFNITNSLISFNKHNSLKKIPQIIKALKENKSIALVSDAGMPGICDPGEDIAKAVKLEGFDVICIPGACAALTALISSGMPSSSFIFLGFLASSCLFIVDQRQFALVFALGEIKKVVDKPGLYVLTFGEPITVSSIVS